MKICNELKCDVGDIMEFVPDEDVGKVFASGIENDD